MPLLSGLRRPVRGAALKLAATILRVLIGGLFIGHGTQKLFGWFGGHGLEATASGFDSMGLGPGRRTAP